MQSLVSVACSIIAQTTHILEFLQNDIHQHLKVMLKMRIKINTIKNTLANINKNTNETIFEGIFDLSLAAQSIFLFKIAKVLKYFTLWANLNEAIYMIAYGTKNIGCQKFCAPIHSFIVSTNYINSLTHNLVVVRNMHVKIRGTTLGTRKLNGRIWLDFCISVLQFYNDAFLREVDDTNLVQSIAN